MIFRGIVKGTSIEFGRPLPFSNGQAVDVSVEASSNGEHPMGSAARILAAMERSPVPNPEDVDELERAIESSRLPSHDKQLFKDGT